MIEVVHPAWKRMLCTALCSGWLMCLLFTEPSHCAQLLRRGFFPQGGGCVRLSTAGSRQQPLPPLELGTAPQWERLTVRAFSAGRVVPEHVAQRMSAAASSFLRKVSFCGCSSAVAKPCRLLGQQCRGVGRYKHSAPVQPAERPPIAAGCAASQFLSEAAWLPCRSCQTCPWRSQSLCRTASKWWCISGGGCVGVHTV